MATTLEKLQKFMSRSKLVYEVHEEHDIIAIGFSFDEDDTTYRDPQGERHLQLLVRLAERGEMVAVFAPRAWDLKDYPDRRAVCEAATIVQRQMKLIRFDLDADSGAFTPNVELSLEKAPMCAQQLHRAIAAVLLAVRRYDPIFRHAMKTGIVDMSLAHEDEPPTPPGDVTGILELGNDAGGLDALERLLGDGDTPPIEA
jgi:hypothetical protein